MILPITKVAELFFVLKDLEATPFENYSNSYRIYRNLELLRPCGERYMAEMRKASEEIQQDDEQLLAAQANMVVYQKWAASGEKEDLPLKKLDLSKEKLPLTPAQMGVLFPILENMEED